MGTSIYSDGSQIIDDIDTATDRLSKILPIAAQPILDSGTFTELLNDCQVGTIWAVSTSYNEGDEVVPTRGHRTGRRYKAITNNAGVTQAISGTAEPLWPIYQAGRIEDGGILWMECGPERDLWDIYSAAHRGWHLKADAVSTCFDLSIRGNQQKASQVYDQMIKQAGKYVSRSFA